MAPRVVADVVAEALVAAGAVGVFTDRASTIGSVAAAARARGVRLVEGPTAATAAVMAAVTGKVADALAILELSGADAAAADPGVAYAARSRVPLLVISDAPRDPRVALTQHLKAIAQAAGASAVAEIVDTLRLTLEEPRGPVQLVLPSDVAAAAVGAASGDVRRATSRTPPSPDATALDRAAGILAAAERPLLVIGLHCRSGAAAPWLRALTESVPMPVLTTPEARGVLPDPHPLMHGLLEGGGDLLARADLIVAAGIDRCEDATKVLPSDRPRLALGPIADEPVPSPGVVRVGGDVALIIEELAPRLRGCPRADWDVAELDRLKRARRASMRLVEPVVARTVELVRAMMPAGTIATADEGPVGAAVTTCWQAVGPNELLIGAGVPGRLFAPAAAIGAVLARPGARAVAFVDVDGLGAADDAMQVARALDLPIVLIDVAAAGRLSEGDVTRALLQALNSPGPHVIPVAPGCARQSPV